MNKKYEEIIEDSELARLNLTSRQICDFELIMNGGFTPLKGFMDKENYESVVNTMRLQDGKLWPIPLALDVNDIRDYHLNQKILLCDEYGKPLAIFTISSIYEPDKQHEAKMVYGTSDSSHFGVGQLLYNSGKFYLGGTLGYVGSVDRYDFIEYRHTPKELRAVFKEKGWETIIGFQTRNPLHKAHFSMIEMAVKEYGGGVLLHPSVGTTKEGDIDYVTRTKCYIHLYKKYMKDFTQLSLLPLAMRMAGPREALLHAIIRKNYGCTHFIVGRDHASPGKDTNGMPFYEPYAAQQLVKEYAKEIGIQPIFFKEMVYVEEEKSYLPIDKVKSAQTIKSISGTEFRKMILDNEEIPEWFSFPEVIEEIKKGIARQKKDGLTLFFTGLPSAGKSTIARYLYFKLLEIQNKNITLLDGDIIRQNLSKGLGFSKEDRNTNIMRIGFVANEITKYGGIAICAAIAPYEEARQKNKTLISMSGNYVEIYISTPASICFQRDVKGFYKMAKKGKMRGLTGVNDAYEIPSHPEIVINTENKTPLECVNEIVAFLIRKKLIQVYL